MRRVVIVVLDGLRRDLVSDAHTPRVAAFARTAAQFTKHRSVFPSTTRVASASLATGCYPGRHELSGNTLALVEQGVLIVHDAGHPDFLQHKRRVTGRSLGAPTLAERVRQAGGAVVFSNVSPGAAYAHDPDGHGHVYHRAGSFGPGRIPVDGDGQLRIGSGIDGDRAMTERFVDEVLTQRRPAVAVLWLGHPDTTQHAVPLGSPDHQAALAEADRHAGMVIDSVTRQRDDGQDILLIVGSDHGHQTVTGAVDVAAELVAARLKAGDDSSDVVVAANGTAALIYLGANHRHRAADIAGFLASRPWVDRVIATDDLPTVGHDPRHGLAVAVSMRSSQDVNPYGIAGTSLVAAPRPGKVIGIGCGQHGGLGAHEQAPVLLVSGPGFAAGSMRREDTSLVDIAPTVLDHLGLPAQGIDGRALQSNPTAFVRETGEIDEVDA